jgi:hypothetical protein
MLHKPSVWRTDNFLSQSSYVRGNCIFVERSCKNHKNLSNTLLIKQEVKHLAKNWIHSIIFHFKNISIALHFTPSQHPLQLHTNSCFGDHMCWQRTDGNYFIYNCTVNRYNHHPCPKSPICGWCPSICSASAPQMFAMWILSTFIGN